MKRRTTLASGAAFAGSVVAGATAVRARRRTDDRDVTPPEDTDHRTVSTERIMNGTERETEVYAIDFDGPGPTAMVVGGIHGNEVNGYRAAENVMHWDFDGGTLVVAPRADIVAVERDTRRGPDGDLNRKFPTGEEPTTDLAREIWDVLLAHDPDVVIDLHRSRGLYDTHHRWVGQAIFPTVTGVADAETVIEYMNDNAVPWTMRYHRFTLGNVMDGHDPLLVHKVGGDLDRPGFLVESTKFLLDLDTQIRWTETMTELLLDRNGMHRID